MLPLEMEILVISPVEVKDIFVSESTVYVPFICPPV
tara:strand:- start:379 stop:486 length:108 start_codon:yes stop_codon:yes gene_type:complete